MIYLDLFLGFLRVGCFAFGGAYGAIPLIRDVVLSYGWLTDEALTYMIAVSESSPGPIMVNLATYVGASQGGPPGAVLATLAVVLPSFVMILLIVAAFGSLIKHNYVQAILRGMKPCMVGIVLATGVYMTVSGFMPVQEGTVVRLPEMIVTVILGAVMFGTKRVLKKKISPVMLIVVAAVLGIVVCGM